MVQPLGINSHTLLVSDKTIKAYPPAAEIYHLQYNNTL